MSNPQAGFFLIKQNLCSLGVSLQMEAQIQSQGWPPGSYGDCLPRGRRMNWRTYNSPRRTEGHHLTSSSALGLRPWGQCPYPRKDSRWWTGLYFYNIKDQETPSTVLITGAAALVTDTCIVEPAHCCTQGC